MAEMRYPELPPDGEFSDTLAVLLSVEGGDIDLTWSKLVIDELIDDAADVETELAEIESIADFLIQRIGENATPTQRVAALRTYFYQSGGWNGHQPYTYDFDDPSGMLASHKSLRQYLDTRKGNCVNMPILFLAIGERMGVEMNITTAPRHVFLQFEDPETGEVQHLEATSGAEPQRIVWQRQVLPMTDRAIDSGMYMQRLSKRQQVVVMAEALLHAASEQSDHEERLELADLMLREFPEFDTALMHLASASQALIQQEIVPYYRSPNEMPPEAVLQFQNWAAASDYATSKLDEYGWQRARPNPNVILPNPNRDREH